MIPAANPFSTRYTRPGCIVPLDGDGASVDIAAMLHRLRRAGGMGAIVGPHGSGKSTLLLRLADAIEAGGARVVRLRVRSWRDAWAVLAAVRLVGRHGIVCVDSWECLPRPVRLMLRGLSGVARRGLVVTMHRDARMPVLATCRTTPKLLGSIVDRLPGRSVWYGTLIRAADLEAAYERQRGDIREALYELYDVFERRSREISPQRS